MFRSIYLKGAIFRIIRRKIYIWWRPTGLILRSVDFSLYLFIYYVKDIPAKIAIHRV